MTSHTPSARHRLYDAATQWAQRPGVRGRDLVDIAVDALVAGVNCATLGDLAGAPPGTRTEELTVLLEAVVEELDLPRPGSLERWQELSETGAVHSRRAHEAVRFDIAPAGKAGGFQLLVLIDGVEMTARGAGLGMDPFDILIPTNRLIATPEPQIVPIARCECGIYGCGSTDVQIVRDGDAVHWDWLLETPMNHGATFHAADYDAEAERIGTQHSWDRSTPVASAP